jgi:hypothetical protein
MQWEIGCPHSACNVQMEEQILGQPAITTRHTAPHTGLIFFYVFYITRTAAVSISSSDYARISIMQYTYKACFVTGICRQLASGTILTARVLLLDKQCFTRIIHNEHAWSYENPQSISSHNQQ